MNRQQAIQYRQMIEHAASTQSDEDALNSITLYPSWYDMIGKQVVIGDRYQYNGKLYRVVQSHVVQSDWTPDITPALWTEVSIEEWPDLVVPIPSTNPYMKGDKVTYNGNHYICLMDNCVWTPSELISAWQLVES